jgi:small-conductance mechanosensitive channel
MSNDLQEVDNEELQKAIDIERKNGKCIVAYLDILGFKELVDKYLNPKNTFDKNILEIITTAMEDAKRPINEFLSQGEFKDIEMIKFKQFSDCICLSTPSFYGNNSEASTIGMFFIVLKNYFYHFINMICILEVEFQ